MAHRAFNELVSTPHQIPKPVIAVWGSDGDVNVKSVRVDSATVVNAHDLRKIIGKFLNKSSADHADQRLFEMIKPYVVKF
ncbi:hypothetical protein [Glutamicibacter ardleyensis]|uniref:hypothetical protein n=1 Tax=Glutamicibacter ardleyensis TaxID=225894 RepID=UPI003FD04C52